MRRRLFSLAVQALSTEWRSTASQTSLRGMAEAASAADLKKTPLYDFHLKHGGKTTHPS